MKKDVPPKQYGVYKPQCPDEEDEVFGWFIYDTIEEAAIDEPGLDVYELIPRRLGRFERKVTMVKVKEKKGKKK